MAEQDIDFEDAREVVERHDRWRKQYLSNYYKADWDDPFLYHLTINTDKIDVEEAVELIVHRGQNGEVRLDENGKKVHNA